MTDDATSTRSGARRPGRSGAAERDRPSDVEATGFTLDDIGKALRGIRFGEVRVVVQDGRIVQIDRVEKQRVR